MKLFRQRKLLHVQLQKTFVDGNWYRPMLVIDLFLLIPINHMYAVLLRVLFVIEVFRFHRRK
ncbi:CLUMA_CG008412, isoform A [Clunio marinus]|uniref:CLUMA_CG008412, isoform A n=1 Tax=Clunio marinus TaxID=568069 RepID=A0A1J1I916_9DIPT|nr:CLUMA_CG008412, isoform A [Clunio marinus]